MEQRFFWLKLQEDFFSSKRIKKLRKIAGGDTYTIIYLKMQLKSIRDGGILRYSGIEGSFAEELALDLDEDPENVAVTLQYLQNCGLIETSDAMEFLLPYAAENIGSESGAAERVRRFRDRQKNKTLHCNGSVTQPLRNCNAEIEKEIEIDNIYKLSGRPDAAGMDESACEDTGMDKSAGDDAAMDKSGSTETEVDESAASGEQIGKDESTDQIPYREIIDYLNKKTGKNFKANAKDSRRYIRARWRDGFRLEDFKTVIDRKSAIWKNDPKMEIYLRPYTLFSTKFESYLNEKGWKPKNAFCNFEQRQESDYDDLEAKLDRQFAERSNQ